MARRIGSYELQESLGQGGFATVYRARQESLHRDVAIKVLHPGLVGSGDARYRFAREIKIAASLSHPALVRVFDGGIEADCAYIVMELVDGANLAMLCADGPLELHRMLTIAIRVTQGLTYLHEHGILHRDVKPANVLVGKDGRARLADFGLARRDDATVITRTGTLVGSVLFMAPELFGEELATRATDLWALGATLHFLLTARYLLELPSMPQWVACVTAPDFVAPPVLRPDVPAALKELVAALLDRDSARRPATAADVARYLEALEARLQPRAGGDSSVSLLALPSLPSLPGLAAPLASERAPRPTPPHERAPAPAAPRRILNPRTALVLTGVGAALLCMTWWHLVARRPESPWASPGMVPRTDPPGVLLRQARAAVAAAPGDPDTVCNAGQLLFSYGLEAEARRFVAPAYERHPRDPGLAFLMAALLLHEGKLDAAEAMLTDFPAPSTVAILSELWRMLYLEQRPAEAWVVLDAAGRRFPGDPEVKWQRCELELALGSVADAERTARQLVADSPGSGEAHLLLARVLEQAGRLEDAGAAAREALRRSPGPAATVALARILREGHHLEESASLVAKQRAATPGEAALMTEEVLQLATAGRTQDLSTLVSMYLEQDPESRPVWREVLLRAAATSPAPVARSLLAAWLRQDPSDAEVLRRLRDHDDPASGAGAAPGR